MKSVSLFAFAVLAPAASWAGHMGYGGQAGGCSHGCGQLSAILMAGVAVLGWWVLHKAEKDAVVAKWAGRIVGGALLLLGLGGFICGTVSHIAKNKAGKACCMMHSQEAGLTGEGQDAMLPPGHPPVDRAVQTEVRKKTKRTR
ncbi:MAG: hypothetical protein HY401_03200 [Elusimicrobia bacterium]|nr:hypothetical protein [Elusimicrobiota bacterium]